MVVLNCLQSSPIPYVKAVGFSPVKFSTFGLVRKSTEKQKLIWLNKIEKLGKQLK